MDNLDEVLSALADLAWPAIAAVLAFKFYEPLKGLIDSVRGRKFTIKVGENELTVDEASEQQRLLTSDLQIKLAELEKRLAGKETQELHLLEKNQKANRKKVLWVDDKPKNNSYLATTLRDQGHEVVIALSTVEGISKFQDNQFDAIISDMGRPEGEKAGIDLAKIIRAQDTSIPYFIYCGGRAAYNLRKEAHEAGVNEITSSGTTLLSLLPLGNGS